MKNKFFKIMLTILVVAMLATILTGCPPKEADEEAIQRRRELALEELTSEILYSSNELWSSKITDENAAALSDAGDYFTARSWARFATKVVDISGLETGKIYGLIAFVRSDDGAKLLQGEGVKIIDLIKAAGLTSTDAEALVYNALMLYLSEGDAIYISAINDINKLSEKPNLASSTRKNLEENLAELNIGKKSFENTKESRQNAEKALKSASEGIKTLISFAYSNSAYIGENVHESFFEGLSTGTLGGITSGEAATYLGAILDSIQEMKERLEGQVDEVVVALERLSEVHDSVVVTNKLIDDIFKVIDNHKALPALLPILSDVVSNGKNIALKLSNARYAFVDGVMTALGDGYAYEGNDVSANEKIAYVRTGLALAGVDYKATGDTLESQKARAKTLVEKVLDSLCGEDSEVGRSNAMLMSASIYLDSPSGTMVGDISAIRICEYWVADFYLNNFKKLFAKHSAGMEIDLTALHTAAQVLMRYVTGEKVVNVGDSYTQEWFAEICSLAESKMKAEATACYADVRADFDSKIDKFFDEGVDIFITLASSEPVKTNNVNYNELEDTIDELYKSALLILFPEEIEQEGK